MHTRLRPRLLDTVDECSDLIHDISIEYLNKTHWTPQLACNFASPELRELTILAAGQAVSIPVSRSLTIRVDLRSGVSGRYGPVPVGLRGTLDQLITQYRGLYVRVDGPRIVGLPDANGQPTTIASRGGIECALWDALAKRKGCSIAKMLGAGPAASMPSYISLITIDIDGSETGNIVRAAADCSFWGQKWRLPDGPSRGKRGLLRNLRRAERLASAARGCRIMLEIGRSWTAAYLEEFCGAARDLPITWIEEPLLNDYCRGYFKSYHFPLAVGEHTRSANDFERLLRLPGVFFIQPDAVACGGISLLAECRDRTADANLMFAPHGRAFLPALHVAAGSRGPVVLEYNPVLEAERQSHMGISVQPVNGTVIYSEDGWLGLWPHLR